MINGLWLGFLVISSNNNALNNSSVVPLEIVNSSFLKLKLSICLIFFDRQQMEIVFVHMFYQPFCAVSGSHSLFLMF